MVAMSKSRKPIPVAGRRKCAEHIARGVNDAYKDTVNAAFVDKFGQGIDTYFSIIAMAYVSEPVFEEEFTPEQMAWLSGFSDGYVAAMSNIAPAAEIRMK